MEGIKEVSWITQALYNKWCQDGHEWYQQKKKKKHRKKKGSEGIEIRAVRAVALCLMTTSISPVMKCFSNLSNPPTRDQQLHAF